MKAGFRSTMSLACFFSLSGLSRLLLIHGAVSRILGLLRDYTTCPPAVAKMRVFDHKVMTESEIDQYLRERKSKTEKDSVRLRLALIGSLFVFARCSVRRVPGHNSVQGRVHCSDADSICIVHICHRWLRRAICT